MQRKHWPTPTLDPRASLFVALVLVGIGALRATSDTLHELDPNYWTPLADHWLRYLLRSPGDGTILGSLNTQWFKVLGIPAGVALIYLRDRFDDSGAADFHDWGVRGVWIAVFFIGFTVIELEKQFHLLGMRVALLEGEVAALNHVAHGLGAWIAWKLSGAMSFPSSPSDADDAKRTIGVDIERRPV